MKKKNYRNLIIILILLISIGFAYLSKELLIKGNSILHGNKWLIYWDGESVDVLEGSVTANTPTVDSNKTTTTYEVTLNKPGDFYDFSIDAVNGGTIDAMVSLITVTYKENNSIVSLPNCLNFSVKYANGEDVAVKDLIKADGRQKYYINIEYDRDVTESNMIATDRTFNIEVRIDYEQADNTAKERVINTETLCVNNKHQEILSSTVCKRATNLHTEKCLNENTTGYCQASGYSMNEDIIYGTCGTTNILTSGDAFDCDVDGSGTYDEDERFYYVSPRDGDESSEYATLIYYKDVGAKMYNNTGAYLNSIGPVTLVNVLPAITEWNKVDLVNNGNRQIVNELGQLTTNNGANSIVVFNYSNRAARLLTYQEVVYACGNSDSSLAGSGYLDNCNFLLENTGFSNIENQHCYFLETPLSSHYTRILTIYDKSRFINPDHQTIDPDGVRPAIEVPLKNIAY